MTQLQVIRRSFDLRCRRELKALTHQHPGRNLQELLHQWINDPEWWSGFLSIAADDRAKLLSELGLNAAAMDAGGYRTYIQQVTDSVRKYLVDPRDETLVDRHIEHLFVSLGDNVMFVDPDLRSAAFDRVDIQGTEHLEHAVQTSCGAMVLSATQSHPAYAFKHPQFKEIGISTVGNLGPNGSERNSPLFKGLEDRVEILPASVAAVRKLIQRLRSGGVVAVYGDFRFADSGAAIGLQFGRPVLFARSAASIAIKYGAQVIPTTVARQWPLDSGPIEVRFYPPVPMDDIQGLDKDGASRLSMRMSVAVDGLIRRMPAQWRLWNLLVPRWEQAIELGKTDTLVANSTEP